MKKPKPLTKSWMPIGFNVEMQRYKDIWICNSSFVINDAKSKKCHSNSTSWGIRKMSAFDAAQVIASIVIAHLRKKGLRAFLNKMG